MGRDKKFDRHQLWDATRSLILEVGYTAFSFSLLANKLEVSRTAIYKQFQNKEELIIDFMVDEMEYTIRLFSQIDGTASFEQQLDDLLVKMYSLKDVHQVLGLATTVESVSDHVIAQKMKLGGMHRDMYAPLSNMIAAGKREGLIDKNRGTALSLGFIFQLIDVPNFERLDEISLIAEIKRFILYGLTGS